VRPYVPKRILFAITKRRGDGNLEEQAPHDCLRAWMDQFDKRSFAGKHVIELGSGRYARFAPQMLTFSDQVWSRWLDLGDRFHLNRWRDPDYMRAAHKDGFVNVISEILSKYERALKDILPRLHRRFRSVPEDVLAIPFISLHCQQPLNS
jgi:hypothetical protein